MANGLTWNSETAIRANLQTLITDVVCFTQGERDLALKTSQRTYKHQMLKELREQGELDTQIYSKIKQDMGAIKK